MRIRVARNEPHRFSRENRVLEKRESLSSRVMTKQDAHMRRKVSYAGRKVSYEGKKVSSPLYNLGWGDRLERALAPADTCSAGARAKTTTKSTPHIDIYWPYIRRHPFCRSRETISTYSGGPIFGEASKVGM